VWERRARSAENDSSLQRSGAGVAPGRRPLTAGLPAADEPGWAAWNAGRERGEERAGQGGFLGVEIGGARLRFPWGAQLPLEREAMRREVERHWPGGGRVRAQTWLLHIEVLSHTPEGAPLRTDGASVAPGEIDAAVAMAREEIDAVSAEERAFQEKFEHAGLALTAEMLAGSEATVRGSLAGYGIELGPVLEKAIEKEGRTAGQIALDVLDNPLGPLGEAMVASNPAVHAGAESETSARAELAAAAQDLQARAAELAEANADNDRLQVEIQRRRGGVCQTAHHGQAADGPDFSHLEAFPSPELKLHGRRFAAEDEPDLGVQAMGSARRVERLGGELRDAWRAHEARHPVLAAYRDGGGYPTDELGHLAGGPDERDRELVRVSFERLCAIAKARQAVTGGAVSVLELPRVVDKTRARLGVEPGSVQDAFVGNAVADASDPDWLVWVLTALSFASAILLAPATGGSSAALALDVGFFTADIWVAINAAAELAFASAAALTDYNSDRALADADDPSAASLVAALIAAGTSALPFVAGVRGAGRHPGLERPLDSTLIPDLEAARRGEGESRFAFGSLGDDATSPELARTKAGIASHLERFREGASYLLPESSYVGFVAGKGSIGRPDGLYVSTRSAMDDLLATARGDLAFVKARLGIEPDVWNERLWRVDVANPLMHNARLPSGMEEGANDVFIWGGYTRGGMPEAVIDPVPAGGFVATPTEVKP
jgi:hypothetical protein